MFYYTNYMKPLFYIYEMLFSQSPVVAYRHAILINSAYAIHVFQVLYW